MTQVCIDGSKCKMKIGNKISDAFETNSGLRQGCILSPMLFNLMMEKITREMANIHEGINIGNSKVNNLAYADDVDLIADSVQGINRLATSLCETSERIDLKVNVNL